MMLKLFKEIRKTGCGTVGYPYAPLDLPKGYRGKPSHLEEACIACGACAVACPPNAISMELTSSQDQITWAINYGRCVFCGRCEEVCPTFAIKLSDEFELAVMSKEDLEESCAYPVATCACCGKPYASAKEIDYARRVLARAGGASADAPAAASGASAASTAASADVAADVAASLSKIDLCLECRRRDDGVAAVRHAPAQGGALC
ncbi:MULTISPECIES: 4Fe-4S dicluster domain-containing protein [unclassified Adlercreutzia]|uniref:4Fe-4S binding protein n=1 Tax=unclassified Adlercreutzia TaxID=2636013 RepID=UPI001F15460A|nr:MULTISPECIES: 4Fe-4S dicluster domain-containing protein [unclassified Adlercreutzia]